MTLLKVLLQMANPETLERQQRACEQYVAGAETRVADAERQLADAKEHLKREKETARFVTRAIRVYNHLISDQGTNCPVDLNIWWNDRQLPSVNLSTFAMDAGPRYFEFLVTESLRRSDAVGVYQAPPCK